MNSETFLEWKSVFINSLLRAHEMDFYEIHLWVEIFSSILDTMTIMLSIFVAVETTFSKIENSRCDFQMFWRFFYLGFLFMLKQFLRKPSKSKFCKSSRAFFDQRLFGKSHKRRWKIYWKLEEVDKNLCTKNDIINL